MHTHTHTPILHKPQVLDTEVLQMQAQNCGTVFHFIQDKPALILNSLNSS